MQISILSNFRGSAIAKIVGKNAVDLPDFNDRVTMYVFEEMINGKKLTEIINETHENVKYLPGHKLPANVVSSVFVWAGNWLYCDLFVQTIIILISASFHVHVCIAN